MPKSSIPHQIEQISLKNAGNIIVQSQKLSGKQLKGKDNLVKVLEHIGYLQIDTISVVERAHHHVAWSRLVNYKKELLKTIEEKEKKIFEYWAHAASYLPMKDYRFSLYPKYENSKKEIIWFKKDRKLMKYILDKVKAEGPIMSKDLEDTRKNKPLTGLSWDWKPAKKQLWQLFMEGSLMVSGRKGFQKIYDIPERVLPNEINTTIPSEREYIRYLIERDIRANGIVKASEIGHLLKNIKPIIKKTLSDMVEAGNISQIYIENLNDLYYTFPSLIENQNNLGKRTIHILSPFDNLLIQRKRVKELFDYDYAIECYVPKEKRKFGYFGLPILWGNQLIGQIDLKAQRKENILMVNNLSLLSSIKDIQKCYPALAINLLSFASFNNCENIDFNKDIIRKIPTELVLLVKSNL